jgi:LPS-assembly lipoprotein
MWWPEPRSLESRFARFALTLALGGLVAGCFQPLYASRSLTDGSTVADRLRAVDVSPIKNITAGTAEARIAAELRNTLIFELNGGAPAHAPTHRLELGMTVLRQQVIVDVTTSRPDVEQAGINLTYSLVELASGRVVVNGQTFSRVSYDNPGQEQRFARARGRRDAEDRAGKVIAQDIRSRLASYFIAGT